MSAYEAEPPDGPERRIGWRGWAVVWTMYGVVVAVIGVIAMAGS